MADLAQSLRQSSSAEWAAPLLCHRPGSRSLAANRPCQTFIDGRGKFAWIERLMKAACSAELRRHGQEIWRRHRRRTDCETRNNNDGKFRLALVNQPDHLQAIHHRHENINDQQIKMIGLDLLESIATIFRNDNFVVFNFKPRFDRRSNLSFLRPFLRPVVRGFGGTLSRQPCQQF